MDYVIEVRADGRKKIIGGVPHTTAKDIKEQWIAWKQADSNKRREFDAVVDLDEWVGSLSDIKMIYRDDSKRIENDEAEMKRRAKEKAEWAKPENIKIRAKSFQEMREWFEKHKTFE